MDGLDYAINGQPVLSGVTLSSEARRIGVIGRNGSGKSTLARLVAGLLEPSAGRIRVRGVDVFRDRAAALRTVGILFQNPEHQILFPYVGEEIAFGLRQLGAGKAEAEAEVARILGAYDKAHWRDAPVSSLSQGQKHLLCVMSVQAMRPALLILDEPFAGLDIPTRRQLARHLDRGEAALLHISHDPADLGGYDRIYWLDRGRIVAEGRPDEVLPAFTAEMTRAGDLDDLSDLPR